MSPCEYNTILVRRLFEAVVCNFRITRLIIIMVDAMKLRKDINGYTLDQ